MLCICQSKKGRSANCKPAFGIGGSVRCCFYGFILQRITALYPHPYRVRPLGNGPSHRPKNCPPGTSLHPCAHRCSPLESSSALPIKTAARRGGPIKQYKNFGGNGMILFMPFFCFANHRVMLQEECRCSCSTSCTRYPLELSGA